MFTRLTLFTLLAGSPTGPTGWIPRASVADTVPIFNGPFEKSKSAIYVLRHKQTEDIIPHPGANLNRRPARTDP